MTTATHVHPRVDTVAHSNAFRAFRVLQVGFTVAPVIAGIDKFSHMLTNWDNYLAPTIANLFPFSGHTFMMLVGAVEIVAGLLVALRPRIGGYIVMAWLWGIIINFLMIPGYYDIALRDLGLSLGALALALLAKEYSSV